MIGTSDGQQYSTLMEHTMALGPPEKPTGELKTDLGTPGAGEDSFAGKKVAQGGIDRSVFKTELEQHPDLISKMASMVKGEVSFRHDNLEHQQIQLESAFNRAQARGIPLSQALLSVDEDPKRGYYAGGRHGTYAHPATQSEIEAFKNNVFNPVMAGSNLSDRGFGPVTGNASADVARHQFAKGTPGYTYKGESYFNEEKGQHLKNLQNLPRLPGDSNQQSFPSDLDPNVQKVLSQPHIAEAIANPKIDRSHDVPYVAGASAKPNDFTTHVDQHIPTTATISGKTFDPAIPLNIHEQVEREVMNNLVKRGMTDNKAYEIAHHEYAEPAEDAWYRQNGIDVDDVNKWWAKQNRVTEAEKSDDYNFPADLFRKPYPHGEVEGTKHTPSNVAAEWATKTPA